MNIVLECVVNLGGGKYVANFGYDNPNNTEVTVPEPNSLLILNDGEATEYALNNFKSGRHEYSFSKVFTSKDQIFTTKQMPTVNILE